ncbi:uncharacterized protein MONOS_16704 [Monocercomonoides exilis]|uniref:uncharacterized protein n=1 Tax=Monocercomonoides exilis TaxID=2049356 RepID=UPI003559958C|nr:hypothetical protein MONOS_16704 [Monocercomonoides exilis]|eukprot:MONOS_16704.1-p1 / transcript=MONOS_16704.1 / gene=MONOS_16704 / organism=Monocercomonoides_exilis_PA203 / gene_product=unspecified product / transcript_product=unspecified product / location=Mono_scaffold02039:892-2238(-) / protein_length=387 / sequence_SO=supercontig / SO=protein_coding / is_pseudo=false
MEEKTLNERIDTNVIDLNNYQKHDGGSGSVVTGRAVFVNKESNLTVIDIDINKSFDDESKQSVRRKILNKLDEDDVVVQTASGGLRIYANTDDFYANSNRMIKCCTCDEFVDIITSLDESKRSLIVLQNSKVRKDHRLKTNVYQLVRGSGNIPINREVTFFTLFQAINSLPNEQIELAYDRAQNSDNLTANARDNYYAAKQRYRFLRLSPFVLVKMSKIWNNDYYTYEILPLLRNDTNIVKPLDMSDSFSMTDIRRKAETKQHKTADDVICDLSRVMRFVETVAMYIQKDFNIFDKRWGITFVTDTNMTRNLKMIKLWKTVHKTTTAYDILQSCLSKLTLQGVMFDANDTAIVFSIFRGFKCNLREHVNIVTISMFLNFVREVIAD